MATEVICRDPPTGTAPPRRTGLSPGVRPFRRVARRSRARSGLPGRSRAVRDRRGRRAAVQFLLQALIEAADSRIERQPPGEPPRQVRYALRPRDAEHRHELRVGGRSPPTRQVGQRRANQTCCARVCGARSPGCPRSGGDVVRSRPAAAGKRPGEWDRPSGRNFRPLYPLSTERSCPFFRIRFSNIGI